MSEKQPASPTANNQEEIIQPELSSPPKKTRRKKAAGRGQAVAPTEEIIQPELSSPPKKTRRKKTDPAILSTSVDAVSPVADTQEASAAPAGKKTRTKSATTTGVPARATKGTPLQPAPPAKKTRAKKSPAPTKRGTAARKKAAPSPLAEPESATMPFEPNLDPTPKRVQAEATERGQASAPTEVEMLPSIVETPFPPGIAEDEHLQEAAPFQIIDTPVPSSIEEDWDRGEIQVQVSVLTPLHTDVESVGAPTRPVLAQPRTLERLRAARQALALLLLAVFIGGSILLWRDVTSTHLYLYTLDPSSGRVLAQEDIGGGYQDNTTITNPVQVQSSLLFGLQWGAINRGDTINRPPTGSQVFNVSGSGSSWHAEQQFSAPLSHGTLSVAPNGDILVEYAGGLQVMEPGGRLLWQMAGEEPTLGEHPFQPASDSTTVYTLKAASSGLIAAYDLQSGALRWIQKLDDTFDYAAPFLLQGNSLFVAGDHTIYALDRSDGSVRWKAFRPSRTLLILNGSRGQQYILAAGALGLTALAPATGTPIWSFNGQSRVNAGEANATLTPTQFYQAAVDTAHGAIYATGIAWDAQQVREQLWLYAVDASTGHIRWSERIGSDFASADAGRVFQPFADAAQGLVILQQAQYNGHDTITALDSSSGSQRWSIQLDGVTASAPSLIEAAPTTLVLPVTQANAAAALHSQAITHVLLMLAIGTSALGLLLLWLLPLQLRLKRLRSTLHNLPRYAIYPLKLAVRFWRFSHKLFALALLLVLLGAGALEYAQLAQAQSYMYQVMAANGSIQWQHSATTTDHLAWAYAQGSIVTSSGGDDLQRLADLDQSGATHWTTFPTEGSYMLLNVPTQPGTALVALSGHTALNYRFAPDDRAYPHPLDHLYTLYLLDRGTGQAVWQSTIVRPGEQANSAVLGADANFIYVASVATQPSSRNGGPAAQLLAIDQATGNIEWRIFGPHEPAGGAPDYGKLLLQGRMITWQVAKTLYAIDTTQGQIQWRRFIDEVDPQALSQEEAQMAETAGVLLVERSDLFHALDPATGNERWKIGNPGSDSPASYAGLAAAGGTFLIYGGRTLQAVDPADQRVIWSQNQVDAVQSLKLSDDGTLVYVTLLNNVDGNAPTQVLAALDVQTGAVRWTFQPFEQERFVNPQVDGLQYHNGMLFTTICLPGGHTSCGRAVLYAINAANGTTDWKFEANSIYDVQVSPDGSTLVFQANSSPLENLIARLQGA